MRAFVMLAVLAGASPVLAEPSPMFIRAPGGQVAELPASGSRAERNRTEQIPPERVRLRLQRDPVSDDSVDDPIKPSRPSLMEQVRARVLDELPAVSSAMVSPLPIPSADGTLAGLGVLGKF